MKKQSIIFLVLFITGLVIFSCSNDDTDTIQSHQKTNTANRSIPDRTFPIEDLRFQPTQVDLDYFNNIKDKVQTENTILNELSSELYFGEVMWDAPKVIRNLNEGIVYTFVPVFDPTYYTVSHFFGIRDDDGILTYQLESDEFIRQSILDDNMNYHVINSANLFAYFDYNFGFTDDPILLDQLGSEGDDWGSTTESNGVDCFSTSYIIDKLCTCGASHYLSEIGDCKCNDAGQSCGCPDVYSTGFIDCWYVSEGGSGVGPTVDTGGSSGSWSPYPIINNLKNFVDFSTWQLILELIDTPCKTEVQKYAKLVLEGVYTSSFVSCLIQEMNLLPSGDCTISVPTTLGDFKFEEIDSELLDWAISYSGTTIWSNNTLNQFNNPVCDLIGAGLTEAEVSTYLWYLKVSLTDEPDPGYNDDNIPDPYSAYNIENTIANSNKMTQFLIDNPCIKPFDYLGMLLSTPDIVDWAIGYLDGDCGNAVKINYVNLVFKTEVIDNLVILELNLLEPPTTNPDDDDNDDSNDNVYFNKWGYNGLLQFIDGYWLYERSESWYEPTENVHYIFENGAWRKFDLPEIPSDAHFILDVADAMIASGHNVLDLFGLIPGAGEIFDGINASWYYAEGDMVNGALSTASCVPVVGYSATGTKWARNTLKLSDNAFHSAEALAYARRYYGSLGLTESSLSHVFRHSINDVSKPLHGIFNATDDIIGVVDDAYKKILNGNVDIDFVIQGNYTDKIVYEVNMNKVIGTLGGSQGDGSPLSKILFILAKEDGVITNKIINAYPF